MALSHAISFILPAKNEEAGLAATLPRLRALYPRAEIVLVDDGSTDRTGAVAEESGVRVLRSPYSMGNGAAIKRGARAATGEILVFMDADGQHEPADVQLLLEQINLGYDMAVGARDGTGQANRSRGFANGFYNKLSSWMTGHEIRDLTSGLCAPTNSASSCTCCRTDSPIRPRSPWRSSAALIQLHTYQ
jgi:glycosyltransferase involved in cell wall biosynthesis